MKRAPTWDILGLFFVTRLALVLITYFAYILLTQGKYAGTAISITTFINTWDHWDTANYVRIAHYGYAYQDLPFDLAFFPLYPFLISIIAHPLGGGYVVIGMLLSNAAFLGALFILYQIAVDMAGEQVARRTLLYLCIFPTAFFFFAAYTESLFLLLTTGTFLALRRQRWWLAGILGFLAALTRNTGVLLVVPFLYELWLARATIMTTWRKIFTSLAPIAIIPCGTALYCLYCWRISGDPIAFATVQSHWARHFTWPWQGLWQALVELFWNQPFGSFNEVHVLLDLGATLGFIILAIIGWQKLRTSYCLWIALSLITILLSSSTGQHDPVTSNQRFVLEMFPAFITLAILGVRYPRLERSLLWIFPALMATLSLLFVMNKWMV